MPVRWGFDEWHGGALEGMGWRSAPGGWDVGTLAQLCGCVNGGRGGGGCPRLLGGQQTEGPCPPGFPPPISRGQAVRGNYDRGRGNDGDERGREIRRLKQCKAG